MGWKIHRKSLKNDYFIHPKLKISTQMRGNDFHPVFSSIMLDEFANVALPYNFCSLLSTMRSREISSIIIIQNFAQLKALFKDIWETIPGNCDTFIYIGGNEQSTHKYVSELLGKGTIDKKSESWITKSVLSLSVVLILSWIISLYLSIIRCLIRRQMARANHMFIR